MKPNEKTASCFLIGRCMVSTDLITEYFCCDYARCKGRCCLVGDSGAPLEKAELEAIEQAYPHYAASMSEEGRAVLARDGFFDIDRENDLVTPLCADGACVYSYVGEDGAYRCAIESNFLQGRGTFRKPVSCRLYPVRVTRLQNGMDALRLDRWDICRDAFLKGRREKIRVYRFLQEPLTACYGETFYDMLCKAAEMYLKR